jgi:hypothetical protein
VIISRHQILCGSQDYGVSDFDQMGVVVDWLDACRKGDLGTLLDLYAEDASLECQCDGAHLYSGRSALEAYWGPRLGPFSSAGFGLEEIGPARQGVELEYSVAGSVRFRAWFGFSADGKIACTTCRPSAQHPSDCRAC